MFGPVRLRARPRGVGPRFSCGLRSGGGAVLWPLCWSVVAMHAVTPAGAQVPATLNGPPVQVQPTAPEPGVPAFAMTPGTLNSSPGNGGSGSDGGSGTGADVEPSDSLNTMMQTPWGLQAVDNAQALGVNPSALAATCVLESNCQNIGGSGSVAGAFQMTASTYTEMINAALAQNPDLASQIVPGLAGQMDPATESIAASEYLLQGSQYLQAHGVADPSVLDVRGYYNFGPAGGAAIATAAGNQTMASVLSGYSAGTLAANGVQPGETVAQWQASVAAKIGNAAGQSVTG